MAITRVWCLEPGFLIGPDNIAERQDGGAEAYRRSIHRCHDGLPELDEGVNKRPEDRNRLASQEKLMRSQMVTAKTIPDGFSHLNALFLLVVRQASDEIQEVKATAENAANGTKQHQLTVI